MIFLFTYLSGPGFFSAHSKDYFKFCGRLLRKKHLHRASLITQSFHSRSRFQKTLIDFVHVRMDISETQSNYMTNDPSIELVKVSNHGKYKSREGAHQQVR